MGVTGDQNEFKWRKLGPAEMLPTAPGVSPADEVQAQKQLGYEEGYAAGTAQAKLEFQQRLQGLEQLTSELQKQRQEGAVASINDTVAMVQLLFSQTLPCALGMDDGLLQRLEQSLLAALPDRDQQHPVLRMSVADLAYVQNLDAMPLTCELVADECLAPGVMRLETRDSIAELNLAENLAGMLADLLADDAQEPA